MVTLYSHPKPSFTTLKTQRPQPQTLNQTSNPEPKNSKNPIHSTPTLRAFFHVRQQRLHQPFGGTEHPTVGEAFPGNLGSFFGVAFKGFLEKGSIYR